MLSPSQLFFLLILFSKCFLPEIESKLLAFGSQDLGQGRSAAVEDSDSTPILLSQLAKLIIPIGPTSVGPHLELGHYVSLVLRHVM